MNKGQIEAGELIMVVIIVMLLLIVGLIGYSFYTRAGIEEEAREAGSDATVRLAQEAAAMQELKCGFATETGEHCLDLYRVNITSNTAMRAGPGREPYDYYRSRFGQALIEVVQVYPEEESWTIYDHAPAGDYSTTPVRMPVYIYDPVKKTNGFGYMLAARYS